LLLTWGCENRVNIGEWTQKAPAPSSPSSRFDQAVVYDEAAGKAIMFGGGYAPSVDAPYEMLNETWSYDPAANTWTELKPTGSLPPAREGQAMVYDPGSGKVLMFGGMNAAPGGAALDDLWEYDPAANKWTELHPAGDKPRAGDVPDQEMVYDTRARRTLLFFARGMEETTVEGKQVYQNIGELWSYEPVANKWTKLDPSGKEPSDREGYSLVYDPDTGLVLLFGGMSTPQVYPDKSDNPDPVLETDLWAYDPAKNEWRNLDPGGSRPSFGLGQYFVFHPTMHRSIMLLPLRDESGKLFSRMWSYDASANRWTELEPAGGFPPERWLGSMFYVPTSDELMLYGGFSWEGPLDPASDDRPQIYPGNVWAWEWQSH
jgi:hypothetical protein